MEAHESDLSVASEVTQARVQEALKVGAETHEGELELEFLYLKLYPAMRQLQERIASSEARVRTPEGRGNSYAHCQF